MLFIVFFREWHLIAYRGKVQEFNWTLLRNALSSSYLSIVIFASFVYFRSLSIVRVYKLSLLRELQIELTVCLGRK